MNSTCDDWLPATPRYMIQSHQHQILKIDCLYQPVRVCRALSVCVSVQILNIQHASVIDQGRTDRVNTYVQTGLDLPRNQMGQPSQRGWMGIIAVIEHMQNIAPGQITRPL